MAIASLRIKDFRNLTAVELVPCSRGLNIICGNNGSGKTSLLEAIHYLGLGRSFRSTVPSRLIRSTADKFSLFIQLITDNQCHVPVGAERDINGSVQFRMAEKEVSMTELAYSLPIRVINAQSHHLLDGGPVFRRRFLDWGLFYHQEGFLSCWRHFERALRQRNAVLREQRPGKEIDIWSHELAKYGLALDQFRREYVHALKPMIAELSQQLLTVSNLEISYQSGWDIRADYASILTQHYHDEKRFGHTQFGPHRADLDIKIDHVPVKHLLSRGQQKLLICAMILAQGSLLAIHANKGLIYLVDDLPSELDVHSRQKLISLLFKRKTQVFITTIESEDICHLMNDQSDASMKVFHVEHGNIMAENQS